MNTIYRVAWSNPHKPIPPGFAPVILRMVVPRSAGGGAGKMPAEIEECWQEMHPYGYSVFCEVEVPEPRRLAETTKQRIRRRNLWKRLLKRYPMFVSDWYSEQVQARPDYYGAYVAGEFADVVFARGAMGSLKLVLERSAA